MARLREVSSVAADLQKSLKKADVSNIEDQVQIQKFWKAMTLPRIDLSVMTMKVCTLFFPFHAQNYNLGFNSRT